MKNQRPSRPWSALEIKVLNHADNNRLIDLPDSERKSLPDWVSPFKVIDQRLVYDDFLERTICAELTPRNQINAYSRWEVSHNSVMVDRLPNLG